MLSMSQHCSFENSMFRIVYNDIKVHNIAEKTMEIESTWSLVKKWREWLKNEKLIHIV